MRRKQRHGPEIVFEEYLLRRAALDRAESERHIAGAVAQAVSRGITWDRIGQLLRISANEAQETYGGVVREAS